MAGSWLGRANGKVILVGEHAVVYGTPAVAVGVHLGATATAERAQHESTIELGPPGGSPRAHASAHDGSDTGRALAALLSVIAPDQTLALRVELSLPAGVGLGASAAIAVAVARAAARVVAEGEPCPTRVAEAAAAWEAVFHGTASGVDVAAAMTSGPIWFVRDQRPKPIASAAPLELALAVAGPPAATHQMVAQVRQLRDADPARFGAALARFTSLAEAARSALREGDVRALGALLNENQGELEQLGVSTPALTHACELARASGALGAKLTGAGGGGVVIALCPPESASAPVLAAWRAAGLECFRTVVEPCYPALVHAEHSSPWNPPPAAPNEDP
ncbi:MAG: mevalonate kinase [Polyangiaceae bacterium]|nr:mevalonate kinase [Polyangiaceae bacterium]MCW5791673.1 mevalonate kinase [Polyangiaceae bacterium]